MNINLLIGSEQVPVKFTAFPGGESHVAIPSDLKGPWTDFTIQAHIKCADDVMRTLLLTDAVRRLWGNVNIKLFMPYVPYARQDRVGIDGEAFSLKVFCDIINLQKYSEVNICDPHSDVTAALIDRCCVTPQEKYVKYVDVSRDTTVLVSPDAGASKKAFKVAQKCGFSDVIQATKVRDTKTGSIVATDVFVHSYVGDKDFLIVDDICDGGRTFIELAKKLRGYTDGKIYLYVTHGIFSKGLDVLKRDIDHVYTAMPFSDHENNDFLTVLKPKETQGE